jgi:multimeric flavodoxin WrbA
MKYIVISGSRNPQGQTARAVRALARGLEGPGVSGQTYFLPTLKIERCRQCDDNGWGTCRSAGRCTIEDDLAKWFIRQVHAALGSKPMPLARRG